MVHEKEKTFEDEERSLLREQMLSQDELFLLQYLKNANRIASRKMQESGFNAVAYN